MLLCCDNSPAAEDMFLAVASIQRMGLNGITCTPVAGGRESLTHMLGTAQELHSTGLMPSMLLCLSVFPGTVQTLNRTLLMPSVASVEWPFMPKVVNLRHNTNSSLQCYQIQH